MPLGLLCGTCTDQRKHIEESAAATAKAAQEQTRLAGEQARRIQDEAQARAQEDENGAAASREHARPQVRRHQAQELWAEGRRFRLMFEGVRQEVVHALAAARQRSEGDREALGNMVVLHAKIGGSLSLLKTQQEGMGPLALYIPERELEEGRAHVAALLDALPRLEAPLTTAIEVEASRLSDVVVVADRVLTVGEAHVLADSAPPDEALLYLDALARREPGRQELVGRLEQARVALAKERLAYWRAEVRTYEPKRIDRALREIQAFVRSPSGRIVDAHGASWAQALIDLQESGVASLGLTLVGELGKAAGEIRDVAERATTLTAETTNLTVATRITASEGTLAAPLGKRIGTAAGATFSLSAASSSSTSRMAPSYFSSSLARRSSIFFLVVGSEPTTVSGLLPLRDSRTISKKRALPWYERA